LETKEDQSIHEISNEGKSIAVRIKIPWSNRRWYFVVLTVRTSLSAAYKRADGRKIDGRRVVVDVERGRTVKGWRPRRLGLYFNHYLVFINNF
jgi:U1 small nuclear ribonucleoprotein